MKVAPGAHTPCRRFQVVLDLHLLLRGRVVEAVIAVLEKAAGEGPTAGVVGGVSFPMLGPRHYGP